MTCPTRSKTARVTVLTALLLAACADNGPGFSAEPSGDPAALIDEQRSESDGGDHGAADLLEGSGEGDTAPVGCRPGPTTRAC